MIRITCRRPTKTKNNNNAKRSHHQPKRYLLCTESHVSVCRCDKIKIKQSASKAHYLFIHSLFLNFAFEIETNEMWLCLEFKALSFHVLWFMFQMTTFSCRSNCVLELRCTIYAESSLSINCFNDKTLLNFFFCKKKDVKKNILIINNGSESIFTWQMHEPIHIDDRNFCILRHFLHLSFFTAFCSTADIHAHTHTNQVSTLRCNEKDNTCTCHYDVKKIFW